MGNLRNQFGRFAPVLRVAMLLLACFATMPSQGNAADPIDRLPEFNQPPVIPDPEIGSLPRIEFDRSATPYHPDVWTYQVLPEGLLYKSYLAGVKEPRMAGQWVYDKERGWLWDIAFGGRVGILRYGTRGTDFPQGWQIDMEGAALPQLDFGDDTELAACDYRFGVPITWAWGKQQLKLGYYHLSSHLGDELMLRHPDVPRINFVRDALMFGYSFYLNPDLRLYAEVDWALSNDDGAEPFELQFGVDYAPGHPTGRRPAPFIAVNGHLREEVDYGGSVTVQSGWAWRGESGHLLRMGMQCYVGMADQYEFYDQYESKIGFGLWYDY